MVGWTQVKTRLLWFVPIQTGYIAEGSLQAPLSHTDPQTDLGATSWCQPQDLLGACQMIPFRDPSRQSSRSQVHHMLSPHHLMPKGSTLLQTAFNSHLNQSGLWFPRIWSKWSELTYLSSENWAALMNGHRDGEVCVWKHRSTSPRITVCLWDLHE